MKREILTKERNVTGCCPGHDKWPAETYRSRRSKKARSRDKKKEHQLVRQLVKKELKEMTDSELLKEADSIMDEVWKTTNCVYKL